MMQYGPAAGYGPLREWLGAWYGVGADSVLITNGSLQLIEFLCLRLIQPGDVVFTENPTYDRTITTTKTKILTSPDAAVDRMREMVGV